MWIPLSKLFEKQGIAYGSVRSTRVGVKLVPESAHDHRAITKILKEKNIEFHTFFLRDEKKINAVIKGISSKIPLEDIKNDLLDRGYTPEEMYRLKTGPNKKEGSFIKILLPMSQRSIYTEKCIAKIAVEIEPQQSHNKDHVNQCHRCQRFGHTQTNCHANPRCVKCTGDHHYKDCSKPRDAAPACVNCGDEHPANYGGCPEHPKNKPSAKKVSNDLTFARATQNTTNSQNQQPNPSQNLTNQAQNQRQIRQTTNQNQTYRQTNNSLKHGPADLDFNHPLFMLLALSQQELQEKINNLRRAIFNNTVLKTILNKPQ